MSLPTHLRDIDVSKCFCSLSKNKDTQKDVIKLHAMPGRRTNISCQLGDDDMVDVDGNPAPLVPLKGPSSFEDTQPDKPSIFTRCSDVGTVRVLQAIDELLPNEMERLGLKEYKRENYRPLYHAPDPESDKGGSGAISIKFDKVKLRDTEKGVVIMELEDQDDEDSEIRREGELDEIQPGITESMYMRISISSIWKGRGKNPEWGATIWCNKIAVRVGTKDDGLVIGSRVLRGDQMKDIKPSKRGRSSRESPVAPAKKAKRVVKEESDHEDDFVNEDDVSTAPVASRSEHTQEDEGSDAESDKDEASDVGNEEEDDGGDGSDGGDEEEDDEGDASDGGDDEEEDEASDVEEEEEEEERVPTPPPAPKPKKKSSKTSKSRSSRK
jgi:hypothetical protein